MRALGWSLNALGIAVTITLGVWPDARNWFLDHAGLGWLLVILLAVATAVLGQVVYHQSRSHARLASENDARLLAAWLGDWKQSSEIMQFFAQGFLVFSMEQAIALDVDRQVSRWSADARVLSDPSLGARFAALKKAAGEFNRATSWWMFDDGHGRYELAKEWRDGKDPDQRKKYQQAHDEIETAGNAMHTALIELFAAMHERGIPS
jgi:hypothetical protein